LLQDENHIEPLAAPGWEGVLALLEQRLSQGPWSDARARIVVADQWVRYSVVPWSDALSSAAERLAHARELMSGIFGDGMTDWTLSLSEAPPGASCLVSAMPSALLESLREMTARHGQKLASVQPQLIAAYNTWRHVLPAGDAAWFVTVEEGSLAALRMCARASTGCMRCASAPIGGVSSSGCRPSAGSPARVRPTARLRRLARSVENAAPGELCGSGVARRCEPAPDHSAPARAPAEKGGMRQAIQLDFAGGRRRLSWTGSLLLALGVAASVAVLLEYRVIGEHRAGLELKLAALIRAMPRRIRATPPATRASP